MLLTFYLSSHLLRQHIPVTFPHWKKKTQHHSLKNMVFLFTIVAVFLSALIIFLSTKLKSKSLNLPPGPPGWPVVGNLFQFSRSGKSFIQFVDELRFKYGPIFTLKMGTRTLIIISDAKLVHEALIDRGALFATRPTENPTRAIFSSNKFTVNASVYGPVWRSLRRNMVQNMLSSYRIKEFRNIRDIAMDKFIDKLKAEAEANGGVVWVLKNARFAVFCILLAMCFGLEMTEDDNERMDRIMKSVLIVLSPRIDDFLPLLRPFFSKQRKKVSEVRKEQLEVMIPFIEKRRKALQTLKFDKNTMSFSYLDTLFDLQVEGRKTSPTNAELVSLCSEFLNGGTDTTATAIEWGIARLIENLEIQTKLFDEIQNKVGSRKVDEKDIDKLDYLQAVVKELLRKHPPTYFLLTHAVTEATTLAGYDIPIDANVEFFTPGVNEDPKIWRHPEKFDPERFLSGKEDADITGVKAVKMTPFGVGRRICPGLGMGTMHVHLMLARMVQEFEWSVWPDGGELDLTDKFEFTVVMKNPIRALIKPRV